MYEIHLTLLEPAELLGWKSSVIDGDPDGVKYYLTKHEQTEEDAFYRTLHALVALKGKQIVRAKIELTVMDTESVA